jgi:hypothetical protein
LRIQATCTTPSGPTSGSASNSVVYARSLDGGRSFASVVVSAAGECIVEQPVSVVLVGGDVHVGYVAGSRYGDWDVRLATRLADGSWSQRNVNDEPARCATHALPALLGDPARGVVHVSWLENRFGPGAVAYASCPTDPRAPCGPNESVSDVAFPFDVSHHAVPFLGDYNGLGLAPDGTLWAAWSDSRTGVARMYAAQGRP